MERSILGVGMDGRWQRAVRIRLTAEGAGHDFVDDPSEARDKLCTGEYEAVITTGMAGEGIGIARMAEELGVRAVLLSRSTLAIHSAKEEGIQAFHMRRLLNAESLQPIINAAIEAGT